MPANFDTAALKTAAEQQNASPKPAMQKSKSTISMIASSAGQVVGKVVGTDDIDDKRAARGATPSIVGDLPPEGEEGPDRLSGETRLSKVTRNPGMDGLMAFTRMSTTRDIKRNGVSPELLQDVVLEDEREIQSCFNLPVTIICFCMYMVFFQQHYGTSFVNLQESAIRQHLGSVREISDIAGVYDWLENTFVPFLSETDHSVGADPTKARDESFFIGYQELMGGFLIRTQRSESKPCSDDSVSVDRFTCFNRRKTNATGKAIQEDSLFGALGGWERDDGRRLHAGQDADGPSWFHEAAGRLTRWFPRQASTEKIGEWREASETSQDAWSASETSQDRPVTTHYRRASKQGTDMLGRLARPRRKPWMPRAKGKKRRALRKTFTGWRPMKGLRRLFDPMSDLTDSRRADQVERPAPANGRRLAAYRPEFSMGGWIPYPYVSNDIWQYIVPMSVPEAEVKRIVKEWKAGQVIDRSTTFFGVEAIFRNPTIGNGLISHLWVNFLFSRGGNLYVEVSISSLVLKENMKALGMAFIWIITLIANSMGAPARACTAWKKGRLKRHLKRGPNMLEWFLIICAWVIIMCFMAERWGVRKFNKQVSAYAEDRQVTPAMDLKSFDIKWFRKIYKNVFYTGNIAIWLIQFVANYHVLLVLRFWVASQGQKRIGLVLRTMAEAGTDLAHLAGVFGIIFFAYVISGHILFGRRMPQFATVEGAMAYTMQIVLQKEFEFMTLTEQDFYTSCFWIWTFVFLVVLVLVNFALAVMFDKYGQVRSEVTEQDSMYYTAQRIFLQWKFNDRWVANNDIMTKSKQLAENHTNITARVLKKSFPRIPEAQVDWIYNRAKQKAEFGYVRGQDSKTAVPMAMAATLLGVNALKDGIQLLKKGIQTNQRLVSLCSADQYVDEEEDKVFDEDGQPLWIKRALVPFLNQQHGFLTQAQRQIAAIEGKLKAIGIGKGVRPSPFPKPANPQDVLGEIIQPDTGRILPPLAVAEKRKRKKLLVATAPSTKLPERTGKVNLKHEGKPSERKALMEL